MDTETLMQQLITEQQITNALLSLSLLLDHGTDVLPAERATLARVYETAFGDRPKQPLAPTAFGDDV